MSESTFNTDAKTFDADLIPAQDAEVDPYEDDPDYDPQNDAVDPQEQGHAPMEPDPGTDA